MSPKNASRIIRQIGGDEALAPAMILPSPHQGAENHVDITQANRESVTISLRTVDSAIALLRGMKEHPGC